MPPSPVESCGHGVAAEAAPGGSRTVRAKTHEQRARIRRMLREADDLGKRPKAAIEILKVRRVIGGAGSCLLIDAIRRPPKAAIVAKIEQAAASKLPAPRWHVEQAQPARAQRIHSPHW